MPRAAVILLLLFPGALLAADINVNIEGIEDDRMRENVRAFLGIEQYRENDDLTEPMIRRLHQRAPMEIRRALMPFGYYRSEVEGDLRREGERWVADYRIRPGPPVQVESVEVRIAGDEAVRERFRDIVSDPPIRAGSVLRHNEYRNLKDALINRARQHGYIDARFIVQRLEVDPDTLQARVQLELDPDTQFHFGEIEIRQDILDDDFTRRFLDFETGDPLDYNQLLDLQYALTDSEYFSSVQVDARREDADEDQHVPVVVLAEPNKRSRYSVGLGYGTDTGPRLTLGFQRRYVNRRGHRLGVEARIAEVEDSYTVRYTIPLENPSRESLQLFAGTLRQERADTESDRTVFGVSRVRTLGDWEQTLYLRAEREDSLLPESSFRTESLIPGASWLKTAADDLFYTRDGYKLYADLHGSAPALGSETEFVQLHVMGKRIFPLADRWRLLLRAEAGATTLGETSELPISQRFFAGGDYSVRGFDYNRIAPADTDGNIVGGQYLVTGSAEIEYRFAENWAVAAFSDAGNAMNELEADLKRSHGIGLRWISPVGVVRLDFARPVNADPMPAHGVEIHISIGPDL